MYPTSSTVPRTGVPNMHTAILDTTTDQRLNVRVTVRFARVLGVLFGFFGGLVEFGGLEEEDRKRRIGMGGTPDVYPTRDTDIR